MAIADGFGQIAPYAAWMVLMTLLPATASGYAVRTAVTAALLGVTIWRMRNRWRLPSWGEMAAGVAAGLAVLGLWILPEQFDWEWYRRFCIVGEGGTEAIAEASAAMIAVRLFGSAVVIAAAEELFFRKWLIGFAGFWWMVVLFAVEHDRWLVGALAGMIYGALYLRKNLCAAIIAHMTTNLMLGLWVLKTGQWQFW